MIQLRFRERALLRQGQLFEPTASSGPAAMLLAISRNLSCIPPTESLPGPISSPSGVPLSLHPHGTLVVSPTESLPEPISSPSSVRFALRLHTKKIRHLQSPQRYRTPISYKLEMRLELTTPSLRVKCSTD